MEYLFPMQVRNNCNNGLAAHAVSGSARMMCNVFLASRGSKEVYGTLHAAAKDNVACITTSASRLERRECTAAIGRASFQVSVARVCLSIS